MDALHQTESKCNHCPDQDLTVSPSGGHLICPKCGRIATVDRPGFPSGIALPYENQALNLTRHSRKPQSSPAPAAKRDEDARAEDAAQPRSTPGYLADAIQPAPRSATPSNFQSQILPPARSPPSSESRIQKPDFLRARENTPESRARSTLRARRAGSTKRGAGRAHRGCTMEIQGIKRVKIALVLRLCQMGGGTGDATDSRR